MPTRLRTPSQLEQAFYHDELMAPIYLYVLAHKVKPFGPWPDQLEHMLHRINVEALRYGYVTASGSLMVVQHATPKLNGAARERAVQDAARLERLLGVQLVNRR